MIRSENLGENDIFEPWFLSKNVSFFQFSAWVIFFSNHSKNEKFQILKKVLLWPTPKFNTNFGQVKTQIELKKIAVKKILS